MSAFVGYWGFVSRGHVVVRTWATPVRLALAALRHAAVASLAACDGLRYLWANACVSKLLVGSLSRVL